MTELDSGSGGAVFIEGFAGAVIVRNWDCEISVCGGIGMRRASVVELGAGTGARTTDI